MTVLIMLLAAMGAFIFMIANLPDGKSLGGVISQFMVSPTPTTDVNAVFTGLAQTAIVENTPAYLRGPATITPAGGPRPTSLPTSATPSTTSILTTTTSPTLGPTATPTGMTLTFSGVNCVPFGTAKTGRVVDILDGVSVRIMMDELIYTVHYIGVDLPGVAGFADAAALVNGQLVFGHDVQLYSDPAGNDTIGQLFRYIIIDGKLINLELIRQGLVSFAEVPTGFACSQAFNEAEQTAKTARIGQWK